MTVNVTITGTAVNGVDYETLATTVVIPAGQLVVAGAGGAAHDALTEAREWVTMTLAPGDYARLSTLTIATVTVVDTVSDVREFRLHRRSRCRPRRRRVVTPPLSLLGRTGSIASDLVVTLVRSGTAAPGADYADFATSVVIPAGQAFTTVTVTPVADGVTEPIGNGHADDRRGWLHDPAAERSRERDDCRLRVVDGLVDRAERMTKIPRRDVLALGGWGARGHARRSHGCRRSP